MRKIGIVLAVLAFIAGPALAVEAPRTVGDYGTAMNEIAERLDRQLADRQKVADAAGAQRLGLIAAMIRRVSAEFRAAEQTYLVDDADRLPPPVKSKLDAAFARSREAEARAAADPRFVDEAHATFNALIDALPVNTPHPTFYGLLSNDLVDSLGRLPADVVIYGDRLIDPIYGDTPGVLYGETELPASALKATASRVEIMLPAQVKAAVRFSPPPCEQRPSFGLRVHDVYAQAHGVWPIVWHSRVLTNADLYALASPVVFEAKVEASIETYATTDATVNFDRRSDFTVADCEQTKTVQVDVTTPPGASDIVCKSAWADTAGQVSTSGDCERRGDVLRGSGVLTGLTKVCSPDKLCACSSHSQGFLEVSGSYRVARSGSTLTPGPGVGSLDFPAGGLAQRAVAPEGLKRLKLDIGRLGCAVIDDTLEMSLGDDASATAVSKSGAFRSIFQAGQLTVGSAEAFAP